MSIESIDSSACRGCGRCDSSCPMDVIYFDRERRCAVLRYLASCQTCFLCVLACPAACITVSPARREAGTP